MKADGEFELTQLPEIRPRQVRPKLAFLIYNREILYHYEPVLALLDPAEVDLIVYAQRDQAAILQRLSQLPFAWYDGRELMRSLTGYQWLVSNLVWGLEELWLTLHDGRRVRYQGAPIRLLGAQNVRFMYSLGADYANFADWNHLYDVFLCYGPHQAKRLAPFAGLKLLMGYPRYDSYFTQPLTLAQKSDWLVHFGCDPGKPVLVWFTPLMAYHPGLACFADAISALSQDYNVLVKPHPESWIHEPEYVAALSRRSFTCLIQESLDNLVLFQLADQVIAEYGGPAYGALYTDKNLLLLDHPGYTGQASAELSLSDTDQWLRRQLVHLGPEQAAALPSLLQDQAIWQAQKPIRAWLRQQFFAPTYGYSSQVAAELLRKLLAEL